ncbi:2-keto-4-pentenoate hydratase/2-oxohepta-3-ene-1,7-dioic acid hydratase in catechol pathway [Tepidamorphus gemmatus]|uniref:2-keto-4-pentenoate hydratase/2-oxohepta-3-ene-1,7-dioic acid hydratase in catechol pathway n=1 Tax=Tepidamorphus gemmatus TaxID=747076 RepID=A0A4R3MIZ5_9HYPH|nr:fumarylacetoacetate hydrolase family protein [Tepidamorphus gemmatus]TCT12492.1 2-keto-4-pentenoate hydratase/2-oxohepta-3-ene-1,7-dioic acid hydratase in catechol pathway [Tepidamorphus gemmatus]
MKLVRYGQPGAERPGIIDTDGTLRDLSGHVADITGAAFEAGLLDTLRGIGSASLPAVAGAPRLGPCVGDVRTFWAIGLNYTDHAEETGAPIPKEPILFNKARSCIVGPNDTVVLPPGSRETDWEVELALLIGRSCYRIDRTEAAAVIAGYFICNDISERDFQLKREGLWTKGKCCPTFGPIGPWLVTPDEFGDPQDKHLWLDLNGERMQTGHTARMIFPVTEIVSYLSHFVRLEAGDIITTGTPPGVGLGMKPNRFLRPGDEMRLGIDGLGEQRQSVVAYHG